MPAAAARAADHTPGVSLRHRLLGQHGRSVPRAGAKQPALAVLGDAGGIDVGAQRLGEHVMARHRVLLAAFLVQLYLPTGSLRAEILDLHMECGADAGEGVGEGGDQRAVAQIANRLGWNAVEKLAPLGTVEHRRLAGFHDVRSALEDLISKGKHPAATILKARVLLKADVSDAGEGWSDSRIAMVPRRPN